MDDPVRRFYDALANDYDLLFADWRQSMERQAASLGGIIDEALGLGPLTILDCACGIGTQAIGLALRGYRAHAADLSPEAVARAAREANALGASLTFGVADLRTLAAEVTGEYDVVLACDNALPHLLDDVELRLAVANMAAKLRPGGLFLASLRDYDRLARERPRSEGPRVFGDPARRMTFQVWDWSADGERYQLHQFILQREGDTWRTVHFTTPYRALRRSELDRALQAADLTDIRWYEPEESGYFQPLVTARKP